MSERRVLAPLRRVSTDVLEVGYYETCSAEHDTVLFPHNFPYDIHSYVDVAPLLADSGFRGVVPRRAAKAFADPDDTDVVLHRYRHRLGSAPGAEEYAGLEARLGELPAVTVPAVTLDGSLPATDGSSTARHCTGPRLHRKVAGAGHNLPQEHPEAFAAAVRDARVLRQENAGHDRLAGRRQDTT
ncbi:alpha/beta fold hydrolase [Streptomyces sp. R39]|uniref:Alpha/beta fold hydrolase n=1 Tax=Streptomyces sp. R39 TaxID=3238631 RepID=A0AB39QZW7_9ACTN